MTFNITLNAERRMALVAEKVIAEKQKEFQAAILQRYLESDCAAEFRKVPLQSNNKEIELTPDQVARFSSMSAQKLLSSVMTMENTQAYLGLFARDLQSPAISENDSYLDAAKKEALRRDILEEVSFTSVAAAMHNDGLLNIVMALATKHDGIVTYHPELAQTVRQSWNEYAEVNGVTIQSLTTQFGNIQFNLPPKKIVENVPKVLPVLIHHPLHSIPTANKSHWCWPQYTENSK